MGLTESKQIDYSLHERMLIQISIASLIEKLQYQHWDEFCVLTQMIGDSLIIGGHNVITKEMLQRQNNKVEMISRDLEAALQKWNAMGLDESEVEDYAPVETLVW